MNRPSSKIHVLILGSGAREHALGVQFAASNSVRDVVIAPGNGGTQTALRNANLASLIDSHAVVNLARAEQPGFIVIGPEAPLVAGVADALREAGFSVFGPGAKGAMLEGSKAFFKQFATRYAVPTAAYQVFTDAFKAHSYVDTMAHPVVVKADGLCAGKGVVVCKDALEAHQAIDQMLTQRAFGEAGAAILIEDCIQGEEASIHILLSGNGGYLVLPAAQDHKRIFDGDQGPNTGGMGAYAPAPLVTDAVMDRVIKRIVEPTLEGLAQEAIDFRGVLFVGLMITPEGEPIVLEYNTRFGDPETEVLMPLLGDDTVSLFCDVANGSMSKTGLLRPSQHAVAVVLAAAGYPEAPRLGDPIEGIENAAQVEGVSVFHAGTRWEGGRLVTAGGRVITVSAVADSLGQAVQRAYEACACIHFSGCQMRHDIAYRALGNQRK